MCNKQALEQVFTDNAVDAVIHFAGFKAVRESVNIPIPYYQNNIGGTLNLFEVMHNQYVKNSVFCSPATVYGEPARLPITEDFPLSATNPYGRSKLTIEEFGALLPRIESRFKEFLDDDKLASVMAGLRNMVFEWAADSEQDSKQRLR